MRRRFDGCVRVFIDRYVFIGVNGVGAFFR